MKRSHVSFRVLLTSAAMLVGSMGFVPAAQADYPACPIKQVSLKAAFTGQTSVAFRNGSPSTSAPVASRQAVGASGFQFSCYTYGTQVVPGNGNNMWGKMYYAPQFVPDLNINLNGLYLSKFVPRCDGTTFGIGWDPTTGKLCRRQD